MRSIDGQRINNARIIEASRNRYHSSMMLTLRVVIAFVALAVFIFCAVGFLATFEPPGSRNWRIAYVTVGLCSVAVMLALFIAKKRY
jgi:uncharacterized membrane protein YuzA (DUF378 family)